MQKTLSIFESKTYSTFEVDHSYQTPKNVCDYMASMLPVNAKTVFEPTPGLGGLVNSAENLGFEVIAADDFFTHSKNNRYDSIIMNPPFSSKSAFIKNAPIGSDVKGMKVGYYILTECMKMSDSLVALMPWYTISDSDVRMRYLQDFGIKSLTSLSRKTFQYARIQTVIIELSKGYKGETIFKTFNY